jgi:hypothetical protein
MTRTRTLLFNLFVQIPRLLWKALWITKEEWKTGLTYRITARLTDDDL